MNIGTREYIEKMRAGVPKAIIHVGCYHMVTRLYTYTNSQGQTATGTYLAPEYSYTEDVEFKFNEWRDSSGY